MKALSDDEIKGALQELPGWTLEGGKLVREWKFADFVRAMAFVNRVAGAAEARGHHPDIDIRYNRVRLALVTHDAGGITVKDASFAGMLNGIS